MGNIPSGLWMGTGMVRLPSRGWALAGLQTLLTVGVLATVSVAPPPRGAMLLVSVTGMAPGEMLARTMPAGAVVLGQGPVAGSLVVRGERGAIVSAALGSGILVLAARETGCGDEA